MIHRTKLFVVFAYFGIFSTCFSYDRGRADGSGKLTSPFSSAASGNSLTSGTGGSPFSSSVSAGNQYSGVGSNSMNGSPFSSAASSNSGSLNGNGNELPNHFGTDNGGGSGSNYFSSGSYGTNGAGNENTGSSGITSFNSGSSSSSGNFGTGPFHAGSTSVSGGSGNNFGKSPFNTASNSAGSSNSYSGYSGAAMGQSPFNTATHSAGSGNSYSGSSENSSGKSPFSVSNIGGFGNSGTSANNMGQSPFNTASNSGGSGNSYSGSSANGMGKNPFKIASNSGGSSGPFNAKGGGSGPFSVGTTGGKNNGLSSGPFSTASAGGASPSGAGMKSPFTVNMGKDKQNPFDMSKYSGSSLFPMSGQGIGNAGTSQGKNLFQMALQVSGNSGSSSGKSPFSMTGTDSSGKGPFSMDGLTTGPGGLGGSVFSVDTGGSKGPGGLTGGTFSTDLSGGPGGLGGGAFENGASSSYVSTNTGGMDSLNSASNSVLQVDNSIYDTSKYQQMLQEQFLLDSYNSELSQNPFNGKGSGAYAGGSGSTQTTGTGNTHFIKDYDKNPYFSLGSYASTDNQAEASIETCITCSDNFNSYTAGQQELQGPFESTALSNVGGIYSSKQSTGSGPFNTDGFSKGKSPFKVNSKASGLITSSNMASYSAGSTGHQGNGYNYDSMLSSPFNSESGSGSYGQQYSSSAHEQNYLKTPFSETDNDVGFGGRNPAGDPANQGGQSMGMNGPGAGLTGTSMRGRRSVLQTMSIIKK